MASVTPSSGPDTIAYLSQRFEALQNEWREARDHSIGLTSCNRHTNTHANSLVTCGVSPKCASKTPGQGIQSHSNSASLTNSNSKSDSNNDSNSLEQSNISLCSTKSNSDVYNMRNIRNNVRGARQPLAKDHIVSPGRKATIDAGGATPQFSTKYKFSRSVTNSVYNTDNNTACDKPSITSQTLYNRARSGSPTRKTYTSENATPRSTKVVNSVQLHVNKDNTIGNSNPKAEGTSVSTSSPSPMCKTKEETSIMRQSGGQDCDEDNGGSAPVGTQLLCPKCKFDLSSLSMKVRPKFCRECGHRL
eukprot:Tbor_TRINITY_DN2102_c0_g1::TRINITY_DN2102_c0_g1_i1::g.5431::m.5431